MAVDWKVPLLVVLLFGVLFPPMQKHIQKINLKLEEAKIKLLVHQDLLAHRDDYLLLQKEMELKGEGFWGSRHVGDFLAELEKVAKEAGTPLLRLEPARTQGESIMVQLQVDGTMNAIGKLIYQSLRLPGLVSLEGLSLSEGSTSDILQADILISRRTVGEK